MEFGRVEDLAKVDLSLPPDDPGTAAVLARAQGLPGAQGPQPRIHVGCPIWNDAKLVKKLKPKAGASSDKLEHYARCFDSVELNASGYGLSGDSAERWAALTPPGFLFCPKVPMDISHARNLDVTGEAFDRFAASARRFGDRLGPAFLQFGESFSPKRLPELERLLRAHAGKLDLALEVRHPAWFAEASARADLFALLEALKVHNVLTDVPGRRDLLHQRLTTPLAFVRFSGHDLGARDLARVDDWALRLKDWMGKGLETLFFFTHHEPKHYSADWGVRFLEAVNRVCGTRLEVPGLVT